MGAYGPGSSSRLRPMTSFGMYHTTCVNYNSKYLFYSIMTFSFVESEYRYSPGFDDYDAAGDVDQWERPEWERSDWVQSYYGSRHQEEAGPSQFSDAPLPTQGTQVEQTPLPDAGRRPAREIVPPDPLTYSQHHTRAARDAARRGRRGPPSADASSLCVLVMCMHV